MIGYIRGDLMEQDEGRLLLAVGTPTSAVGYSVLTPHGADYALLGIGKSVELFIYTHVREDTLDLFGFLTREEKNLFLTFLTVSGIGPKGALNILSGGTAGDIVRAILDRDKDFLTRIPGVGKKIADRMVGELADTLRKKVDAGVFLSSRGGGSKNAPSGAQDARKLPPAGSMLRDAREALVGLGYRENDVMALLERVMDDEATAPKRVEDIVKTALRQLSS